MRAKETGSGRDTIRTAGVRSLGGAGAYEAPVTRERALRSPLRASGSVCPRARRAGQECGDYQE